MNIGDKVRLVHGREEGVIYAFLPGNIVEIEIEDGFRIPVLRNEIVTISPVESQRLVKQPDSKKLGSQSDIIVSRQAPFAEKGIYIAFVSINDRALTLHIINNTDWILPFTAISLTEQVSLGLGAGVLQPRTSQKLTEVLMKDFESWPVFELKLLYFREGNHLLPQPLTKKIKCRAQSFYKNKGKAPVLDKEAFVYQLDDENLKKETVATSENLSADLRASMLGGAKPEQVTLEKPEQVVDLHIGKLTQDSGKLSNDAILKTQLETFESSLEMAIANGMEEITFIHGAGSGALKNELHRRLGKNQHVQYFKDAQKEKFGYGATLVKIK
ncbi:Smr/MutS family protein [Dyadobacter pollutisoli]|uniref:Smr/MutS family protein n=1 Tax=Dyadobacter pollutisoli TaxID=2910158 RepID=A0A9E8N6I8_9BACT|nr:Smr/MutS family protein [Dyadobacter pollutisoli]WAC09486.1 Smr/MutS family protein [Dyadobacter pollutisoli]